MRVTDAGTLAPLTSLAPGEIAHRWPQFLPDGKHFLYQRVSSDETKAGVYVGSLDDPPEQQSTRRVLSSTRQAYYSPSPSGGNGYLVFLQGSTLLAQPFDLQELLPSGSGMPIAESVDSFTTTSHGLFSMSDGGTLAYRASSGTAASLTWFDLQGTSLGAVGKVGQYSSPSISPDGTRIAVAAGPAARRNIWIVDTASGAIQPFTTSSMRDDYPAWSPDGKNIAFSSARGGSLDMYLKPASGPGDEKLLLSTGAPNSVGRWTKDGRFLLFFSTSPETAEDTWALPFSGPAKPVSLLQTHFSEIFANASPNGRWLAYSSNQSHQFEVYVKAFTPENVAADAPKWLVSYGGARPLWAPDGKRLYYLSLTNQVMAVDIDTHDGFHASKPVRLFAAPSAALQSTGWDLSPDGKRFLFAVPSDEGRVIPFTVIRNWEAQMKD
jgi:Tol biopolymer transport system component